MSEITIASVTTTTIDLGGGNNNTHIIQFTVSGTSTGLSTNDYVFVSSGSASNMGIISGGSTAAPNSAINIDSGAVDTSAQNLAFKVTNFDDGSSDTTFTLEIGGNRPLAQVDSTTASISGFKITKATGAISDTNKSGGGSYTEDEVIQFYKDGEFDNSLNGYNFTFYHSGLDGNISGTKQQSDLEANPSTGTYSGSFNSGTPSYYTFSNIVATSGSPNSAFSGGDQKLLVFTATSSGGGGGGSTPALKVSGGFLKVSGGFLKVNAS